MYEIRDMLGTVEMRVHRAVLETCSEERHGSAEVLSYARVRLRDLRTDVYQGIYDVGRHVRAELRELYSHR